MGWNCERVICTPALVGMDRLEWIERFVVNEDEMLKTGRAESAVVELALSKCIGSVGLILLISGRF